MHSTKQLQIACGLTLWATVTVSGAPAHFPAMLVQELGGHGGGGPGQGGRGHHGEGEGEGGWRPQTFSLSEQQLP